MGNWFVRSRTRKLLALILFAIIIIGAYQMFTLVTDYIDPRSRQFLEWWRADDQVRLNLVTTQQEACPNAPFILPADGFIGLLYADPRGPYSRSNPHQGIDIFSPDRGTPGLIPVYAAYDGYISREDDWRSSLIQRVPEDPLEPGRQIWLYYTHMADTSGDDFIEDAFEPGTRELFVEQGTLLGYTGNYNGNSTRGVWVHLHFSIVKDNGSGSYANELEFTNTIDPSQYLGISVNFACALAVPECSADPTC